MKRIKQGLMVCALCMLCAVFLPTTASAAWSQMSIKVTTVIDNIDECPAVENTSFSYTLKRIYSMYNYGVLIPSAPTPYTMQLTHGQTTRVFLPTLSSSTNAKLLSFESNSTTDAHLSLSYIELTDNVQRYTYTDNGKANPSVQAFNWVEISDTSKSSASLTLHFRYNPDIGELEDPPDPNPGYTKRIDYLGDGGENPDTTARGINDYRLYLSIDTEAPPEAVADKDVIFLLDISNSMQTELGNSSRLTEMKKTVNSAIDVLTQNPQNRVSIVSFETYVKTLISHSSDAQALKRTVSNLQLPGSNGGGTNYYNSFSHAGSIIQGLIDPDRETVVFFLSDGEPTACLPAANAIGYSNQVPIGMLYAAYAAETLPTVDRFYSVFIGDNTGNASTLQTITQLVPVGIEKYMIQATSAEQLQNTFSRFLSRVDQSLYDVTITDTLSEYVDYRGASKVVRITSSGEEIALAAGTDYEISYDAATKTISMRLLRNTVDSSRYVLSFNVRSNDTALAYYDANRSFPHVGDAGTDYPGNATSAGQAGFYSNDRATLTYSFSGGQTVSKVYPKPVVQVVEPEAVPMEIEARKVLTGKTLEDGMFTFELVTDTPTGEAIAATAVNAADGTIRFEAAYATRVGTFIYRLREKLPETPEPGMTYDTKEIEVTVTVIRGPDGLIVSDISYSEEPIFTNEYQPQPVWVTLNAQKSLIGRTLSAGQFQFKLLTAPNNVEVETVSNQADGTITFAPLEFTRAGTYNYFIRESVPLPADRHITYDLKTVTATIEVTDDNGILKAVVSYSPDNTFTNVFSYYPASATIQLKKILTGMQLTNGMFEFELKDLSDGTTVKTTNLANGDILFDKNYPDPGIYQYQVREVRPDDSMKYMTYDSKVITVTVSVSDDGTGDLIPTVTYSETPEFYNSYQVRGGIW